MSAVALGHFRGSYFALSPLARRDAAELSTAFPFADLSTGGKIQALRVAAGALTTTLLRKHRASHSYARRASPEINRP